MFPFSLALALDRLGRVSRFDERSMITGILLQANQDDLACLAWQPALRFSLFDMGP